MNGLENCFYCSTCECRMPHKEIEIINTVDTGDKLICEAVFACQSCGEIRTKTYTQKHEDFKPVGNRPY